MMKLVRSLLASALCLLFAVCAHARSWEEIKKGGKIIVATEGQYAPFNYFQGGKLSGFEVELAEAIFQRLKVTVEWKSLGFDALLAGLRQDRWDLVVASHGITDERAKAVTFAAPHYCSGAAIVAKDPAIKSAKDLVGRVIAVQTGTSYMESAKRVAQVKEVKNFPQDTDARGALIGGRVDAWVTDLFVARTAVKANPAAGLSIGDSLFVERIAAAAAKGNASVVEAWNKALAEALADGSYAALSNKFFSTDIRCK
jgi:polar amino acid transport system substrate-binding protein